MQKQPLSLALAACLAVGAAGLAPSARADTTTPIAGGATVTEITGTIVAVNKETRQMTIKVPDGHFEVVDIPKEVKRIDGIKKGFGVIILLTGIAILSGADKWLEAKVVGVLPDAWIQATTLF